MVLNKAAAILRKLTHFLLAIDKMRLDCKNKVRSLLFDSNLHTSLRDLRMILSKWLLLTRLETRTKESTYYASVGVEKLKRIPKGIKDVRRELQHQPILIL